jgi:hypothetical protein
LLFAWGFSEACEYDLGKHVGTIALIAKGTANNMKITISLIWYPMVLTFMTQLRGTYLGLYLPLGEFYLSISVLIFPQITSFLSTNILPIRQ